LISNDHRGQKAKYHLSYLIISYTHLEFYPLCSYIGCTEEYHVMRYFVLQFDSAFIMSD